MTAIQASLQPIYNSAIAYKQGGQITVASTTTLTISSVLCRDFADAQDINVGDYFGAQTATTLNSAVVGLNGIDTGTLSTSKVYHVYAIMDQAGFNPSGFILSLNSESVGPLLPSGKFPSNYSSWRHVGYAVTDSGSHFLTLKQSGLGSVVTYTYDAPVQVLSSGAVASQTAVDLSAVVPKVDGMLVELAANFNPAAASRTATLCTSGGTIASSQNIIVGQVASVHIFNQIKLPVTLISGLPKIDYQVSNTDSSLSLWVNGFVDYLL